MRAAERPPEPALPGRLPLPGALPSPSPLPLPDALPVPAALDMPEELPAPEQLPQVSIDVRLIPKPPYRGKAPDRPPGARTTAMRRALVRAGTQTMPHPVGLGCLPWLLVPAMLIVLLLSAGHHRRDDVTTASDAPTGFAHRTVTGQRGGSSLPGVAMPKTANGTVPVPQVRVVIAAGSSELTPHRLEHELRTLRAWLAMHERPASRYRIVLDGRSSHALRAAQLSARQRVPRLRRRSALRWLARSGRRTVPVSIGVGAAPVGAPRRGVERRLWLRDGAPQGHTREADPRRPHAVAAAIARILIRATGAREAG